MTPRELAENIVNGYSPLRQSVAWTLKQDITQALESFGREQRNQALEDAAKVSEKRIKCHSNPDMCREAEIITKLIRVLKTEAKS